ncbi:hypothetical protein ACUH78_19705, partial [Thauera sp. ZXT1-4]|uniref:hypothetical protein n=1 Tax=Thauera sp. ZXT1-4 TaxID=3460294 RepID=UPI004040A617
MAVDHWGTFITTPVATADSALVRISTTIRNSTNKSARLILTSVVYNPSGKKVATARQTGINLSDSIGVYNQELRITDPDLWSVDKPVLYRV